MDCSRALTNFAMIEADPKLEFHRVQIVRYLVLFIVFLVHIYGIDPNQRFDITEARLPESIEAIVANQRLTIDGNGFKVARVAPSILYRAVFWIRYALRNATIAANGTTSLAWKNMKKLDFVAWPHEKSVYERGCMTGPKYSRDDMI